MDIADAIEATAESDDPAVMQLNFVSATSSRKRVMATRQMILRFLQNVPDDAMVLDLRRAIERSGVTPGACPRRICGVNLRVAKPGGLYGLAGLFRVRT